MTKLFSTALVLTSVACLAWVGGCATGKGGDCCDTAKAGEKTTGSVAVINTVCPVGGDDFETKERSSDLARTWNGKSIGFCCDHCVVKFDKMTDEKKNAALSAATTNKQM